MSGHHIHAGAPFPAIHGGQSVICPRCSDKAHSAGLDSRDRLELPNSSGLRSNRP